MRYNWDNLPSLAEMEKKVDELQKNALEDWVANHVSRLTAERDELLAALRDTVELCGCPHESGGYEPRPCPCKVLAKYEEK